ncbi:Hypothetical protein, putative [Bodo saltans]|uniref:Uncharacterized protein n=1 Tax=Bodo saltans TaxID=75058 RepID=A0A0S4JMV2_BODSA|nr:Hypothetical protein, putative [Bodo saltans]|eukprot:CUG91481.1 Hypothetical protein, putative [Bodo saltans]
MRRRSGGMLQAMCMGSFLGINCQLQFSPERPTTNPVLLYGMRSFGIQPEWYTDRRTQSPPLQSPPLRAWRIVYKQSYLSIGLVSRSLRLHAAGASQPTQSMTPEERAVMKGIQECKTVKQVTVRLYLDELIEEIGPFIVRVAGERASSDLRLTVSELGNSLSLGRDCVAFFTSADRNLILGVAALGDDPKLRAGVKKLDTVGLLQVRDGSMVQYHIYSVASGRDTIAKYNGEQTAAPYADLVQFVVSLLERYVASNAAMLTAHKLLLSPLFKGWRIAVQREEKMALIHLAATTHDLTYLGSRYVDANSGDTLDVSGALSKYAVETDFFNFVKSQESGVKRIIVAFDLGTETTWDDDHNVVVLIGGESGCGKTWRMITNNSGNSNLVVYIRLNTEQDKTSLDKNYATIIDQDRILHPILPTGPKPVDSDVIAAARKARSDAFQRFAKAKVEAAIETACPHMLNKLRDGESAEAFEVRLCFDEMGGNPPLIRACCAVGNDNLRIALNWGTRVKIRMFAAGTGVGTVENPGGSENVYYKLATLRRNVDDPAKRKSSEPSVYWHLRRKYLRDASTDIREAVEQIADHWGDASSSELMLKRDDILKEAMRAIPEKETVPGEIPDPQRVQYMREALLSAVEADRIGRFVLTNARLATLLFARCVVVAEDIVKNCLCLWPSGVDIRREVLQPVAKRFKGLGGLKTVTPEVACRMLVESLRYAIFDNYVSSDPGTYGIKQLTADRGVLVDNAMYYDNDKVGDEHEAVMDNDGKPKTIERTSPDSVVGGTQQSSGGAGAQKEQSRDPSPTIRYTACFQRDVGRFSISPAMVVVLLTLMSIAFGENFANKGDVFEHAVARFLYFAVQVFKDRPVAELVDFIVGHFAVVGKDAQTLLDAKHVLSPSNKTATGVRNIVTFSSLTLRTSASLNQDNLINGMNDRSKPPRSAAEEAMLSEKDRLTKSKRKQACDQFEKLWEKDTGAWIETITGSVASADVVLHIPGVLTLPIQCKDVTEIFDSNSIPSAMYRVLENQKSIGSTTAALFSRKLFGLGAPVIPVLYLSRTTTLTNFTPDGREKYGKEVAMTRAKFDAIGSGCIMAEGIGEREISKFVGSNATKKEFYNAQRLHRIRRNMMLFELRPEEPKDVVVVAIAPQQRAPENDVPPTGKYRGSHYRFTNDLRNRLTNVDPGQQQSIQSHQYRRNHRTGKKTKRAKR